MKGVVLPQGSIVRPLLTHEQLAALKSKPSSPFAVVVAPSPHDPLKRFLIELDTGEQIWCNLYQLELVE